MKTSSAKNYSLKSILGGSVGNFIEWYDWYAYAVFSLYFAQAFFPQDDPTAQLLNTAAIFAIGFLMRPIGGWLFGRYADRIGRKAGLTLSVLMMSFGSFIIALTPTYESIGIWAPLILLLARLLQGLSLGGEYGSSATYLSEAAPPEHRGFFASFQYFTLCLGQLTALAVLLLLQQFFLTNAQLEDWGWRIPFFIGGALAIVAFYLRRNLAETVVFTQQDEATRKKQGSVRELLRHPKAILLVMGLTLGGTIAFYTYTVYMQKFLVNTVGFAKDTSTLLSFVTLIIFMFAQPALGALSDKIGRRPLLIGFGVIGTLATVPLMSYLTNITSPWEAFWLILVGLFIVSGYTSINAIVKAELFPTEIRALGVGLPYALTVAIFGGTVEYIALYFKSIGHEPWFYWYVTGCIFISLVVALRMRETKKVSQIDT
jgi:MHS family alpha-ketoglutarate permease-like MFS transporter